MKAISVRGLWAFAIVHLGKPIENRSRKDGRMPAMCRHRGPLLLHASKGCTRREYEVAKGLVGAIVGHWRVPELRDLPRGGIVGVCNVVAHIDPEGMMFTDPRGTAPFVNPSKSAEYERWHIAGSYGLVLADVRPLPFVACKGALGIFEISDELVPAEARKR